MRLLRRYEPGLISGWLAEEPSRSADDCMRLAREEASAKIGRQLDRMMPGDSHRGLVYQTTVEWETLDPVLIPVWVLAVRYRDEKPPLRVVVNGQTGVATGKAPLSWWRIAIACALGAAVLAAIVWWIVWGHRP